MLLHLFHNQGKGSPVGLPLWRQSEITYLIKDLFSTDISAGSLNGTNAEIGTRAIVDSGNLMSTNVGELLISAGGSGTDPQIRYTETQVGVIGVAGLCFKFSFRQNQDASENIVARLGFDSDSSGAVGAECIEFTAGAVINARESVSTATNTGQTYSRLVDYEGVVVFTETKVAWILKGGGLSDWTVIHSANSDVVLLSKLRYPVLSSFNRNGASKYIEVAILPSPWNTDTVIAGDIITSEGKEILNSMTSNATLWTGATLKEWFKSLGIAIGIFRSGDDYWITQDLGNGLEWRINLDSDGTINSLRESQIYEDEIKKKIYMVWVRLLAFGSMRLLRPAMLVKLATDTATKCKPILRLPWMVVRSFWQIPRVLRGVFQWWSLARVSFTMIPTRPRSEI